MSEQSAETTTTGVSGKLAVMGALQTALAKTAIVSAKIWNPWDEACEPGIDLSTVRGTPDLTAAPITIPEDATFATSGLVSKTSYLGRFRELSKPQDVSLTAQTFDQAKVLLKKGYLQWARANWRGVKGGNCTYLAGVVVGFLSENAHLVPRGATVEQFNLAQSGQGHAFVVIARDPASNPADLSAWGSACVIVDQWYARQRVTAPGTNAVKEIADTASSYYDAGFRKFLAGGGRIYRGPAYSYQELTTLF
jgi:hypothetical protein